MGNFYKEKELIELYCTALLRKDIDPVEFSGEMSSPTKMQSLAHAFWMLEQMHGFLKEGNLNEFNRLIGSVQTIFLMNGFYTLNELNAQFRNFQK